mgnify:CR=1 FL=1
MRIKAAAETAREYKADFFATTLTVSPHKNAVYINETGNSLQIEDGIPYLESDLKRKTVINGQLNYAVSIIYTDRITADVFTVLEMTINPIFFHLWIL